MREQDEWRCPPPTDVQASDFIYMCLSALRVVKMCCLEFFFFFMCSLVHYLIGYLLEL